MSEGTLPLAQFLADRDQPCVGCGYNLRGLATDRCPECGAGVRLGIYPVSSAPMPAVLGLAAAAIGLGGHIPVAVAILSTSFDWNWFVWSDLASAPAYAAAIWWWWRRCRRGEQGRWLLPLAVMTLLAAAGWGGFWWWELFEGLAAY
jgi:hypothetical protein